MQNQDVKNVNIVRVIKYIKFKWARDVTNIGEGWSAFKILTDKPSRKAYEIHERTKLE